MNRLTSNKPEGNIQNALNLFYVKDCETWVRGGGSAPEYKDITLYDFIRDTLRNLNPIFDSSITNEEIDEAMCEWLFDGNASINGIIATLYTTAWAFSELRERLGAYEDTGLEPEAVDKLKNINYFRSLIQADTEGRLVELPCKVGDTVYHASALRGVVKAKVRIFFMNDSGVELIRTTSYDVPFKNFGKTLFLTSEEAEAAVNNLTLSEEV